MHAVDWLPTFVGIAGGNPDSKLDGINMWPAITSNFPRRKEFVYNLISTPDEFRGAIRMEDWKLIVGKAGTPSKWYPQEKAMGIYFQKYFEPIFENDPTTNSTVQLYNLANDPNEMENLSEKFPAKVKMMYENLLKYKKYSVPPFKHVHDPRGDPVYFNGTFTPGWCNSLFSALDRIYI